MELYLLGNPWGNRRVIWQFCQSTTVSYYLIGTVFVAKFLVMLSYRADSLFQSYQINMRSFLVSHLLIISAVVSKMPRHPEGLFQSRMGKPLWILGIACQFLGKCVLIPSLRISSLYVSLTDRLIKWCMSQGRRVDERASWPRKQKTASLLSPHARLSPFYDVSWYLVKDCENHTPPAPMSCLRGLPYMTSAVGGGRGPQKADKKNKISWFVTVTRGKGSKNSKFCW